MVLVTGATGLVGSHLLLELLLQGYAVRAIYRRKERLGNVRKIFGYYTKDVDSLFSKIEWVQSDILDIPSLEIAIQGITEVYHAAALISFDPQKFDELVKVNAEGTANIVNLCLAHSVKKLGYVSTIGAIGIPAHGHKATEETEWTAHKANVYAISKHMAEMEVWRGSQEKLPVVIINPGVILGPGLWHSGSGKFFSMANKEISFYPPGGSGFVCIMDVVRSLVQLMESDITGNRFILVAENCSFKQILTKIAKGLGKKAPQYPLKYWQLYLALPWDWFRSSITGKERTITQNTIHALRHRQDYDHSKLKTILGFEYGPIDHCIAFCAQKYKEDHS